MATDDVRIPLEGGGALRAALALPSEDPATKAAARAGVIVLHEMFGLNDDMRRIASRFADAGYVAVVPDLYSHGNKALCLTRVLLDGGRGSGDSGPMADIEATRQWLAARDDVDGERIGVAGFCIGGGFALAFGVRGGVKASAVNYGTVPKQREKLAGTCPVVASYGGRDRLFAPAAGRLERHLEALGVPHDVKVYERVGHSFMSKDNIPGWMTRLPSPMQPGYSEEEAEDAWARILRFFAEHVQ